MKQDRLEVIIKQIKRNDAKFKPVQGAVDDRGKIVKLMDEHIKPCGDDLILLTLTGHLVIEAMLEMILTRQLDIESLPKKKGRLDFTKKLMLVQVLVEQREPGPNADLFCAINDLNDLRNQIAHRLKNKIEIERDVQNFIDAYHKWVGDKSSNETLSAQLRSCIAKLCKFLHSVIIYFYKLERQKRELLTGEE